MTETQAQQIDAYLMLTAAFYLVDKSIDTGQGNTILDCRALLALDMEPDTLCVAIAVSQTVAERRFDFENMHQLRLRRKKVVA